MGINRYANTRERLENVLIALLPYELGVYLSETHAGYTIGAILERVPEMVIARYQVSEHHLNKDFNKAVRDLVESIEKAEAERNTTLNKLLRGGL